MNIDKSYRAINNLTKNSNKMIKIQQNNQQCSKITIKINISNRAIKTICQKILIK